MQKTLAVIVLTTALAGCASTSVEPPAIAMECLTQEKDGVSNFCEGDACYTGMVRNGTLYLWETKQRMSPGGYSMFFMSDGKKCTFGTMRGSAVPEDIPADGNYLQFRGEKGYPYEQLFQYHFRRVAGKFAEFAR
jgi:hypothetical protein